MTPPFDDERPLTAREREVLQAIVVQYIQTGVPVSSRAVAKINTESLSPATLRGIMADLEEAGFITHPHTSAGRVPTDVGYRNYVDLLPERPRLSAAERRALSDNLYATGGLDSLLARCCKLLSAASHQVGVATAPEHGATIYRHVEFLKIGERRLLILFIAASGLVTQHVVEAHVPESASELARCASYLNEHLSGCTLAEARDRIHDLMREEHAQYDSLARRALELGSTYFGLEPSAGEGLYVDDTELVRERPDLSDFDRMKGLAAALEDKRRVLSILNNCLGQEGIVTAIGSADRTPGLEGCSVVATSYGFDHERVGTLGIIGPTRMNYDRAMALVEYVAQLLGSALASARS